MEMKRRIVIRKVTFSKRKELLRGKLNRNQKIRMIKTNAMECRAVWITDMGYERRRYKKTGGLINMNMEENEKKLVGLNNEHNNKLRSAGNDWRRKSPDTDTKQETKEMERIWAVICTSLFTLFHFMHYLALFCLIFHGFNAKRS